MLLSYSELGKIPLSYSPAACSVLQFFPSCNHIHLASQQQKYALPVDCIDVHQIWGCLSFNHNLCDAKLDLLRLTKAAADTLVIKQY